METDVAWKSREPVLGRLLFALRPFDQQPFFWRTISGLIVAMGGANADAGKARGKRFRRAFTPGDCTPVACGQNEREVLDRDWLMLVARVCLAKPVSLQHSLQKIAHDQKG